MSITVRVAARCLQPHAAVASHAGGFGWCASGAHGGRLWVTPPRPAVCWSHRRGPRGLDAARSLTAVLSRLCAARCGRARVRRWVVVLPARRGGGLRLPAVPHGRLHERRLQPPAGCRRQMCSKQLVPERQLLERQLLREHGRWVRELRRRGQVRRLQRSVQLGTFGTGEARRSASATRLAQPRMGVGACVRHGLDACARAGLTCSRSCSNRPPQPIGYRLIRTHGSKPLSLSVNRAAMHAPPPLADAPPRDPSRPCASLRSN